MKVLITGIDGFTGIHLERFLVTKGLQVFGTVIAESSKKNYLTCNLCNVGDVEYAINTVKPDYIIHLAAISFVGESNASLIYDTNVIGTQNILEAVIRASLSPKKIILASSATVYGNQDAEILDESMCPKPVNHYGISKLAMECIAHNYFEKLNIVITRPFNYTGIGQAEHFLIPKIVKHYREKKEAIELGNLHVAREFNDIDYVLHVYYELMMSSIKSEVINLASNTTIKLLDVINMMNSITGYEIEVKVNPDFVRKNEIPSLSGSTDKLYHCLPHVKWHSNNFYELLKKMYMSS